MNFYTNLRKSYFKNVWNFVKIFRKTVTQIMKISGKFSVKFDQILRRILQNLDKRFVKFLVNILTKFGEILRNILWNFKEYLMKFWEIFDKILRNIWWNFYRIRWFHMLSITRDRIPTSVATFEYIQGDPFKMSQTSSVAPW